MTLVDIYNFVGVASDESLIQPKQNITLIFNNFYSSPASVFLLNKKLTSKSIINASLRTSWQTPLGLVFVPQ
jgi:hypothetical protein